MSAWQIEAHFCCDNSRKTVDFLNYHVVYYYIISVNQNKTDVTSERKVRISCKSSTAETTVSSCLTVCVLCAFCSVYGCVRGSLFVLSLLLGVKPRSVPEQKPPLLFILPTFPANDRQQIIWIFLQPHTRVFAEVFCRMEWWNIYLSQKMKKSIIP